MVMARGEMETSWSSRAILHTRCYHCPVVIGERLKKIKRDCSDAAVLRRYVISEHLHQPSLLTVDYFWSEGLSGKKFPALESMFERTKCNGQHLVGI